VTPPLARAAMTLATCWLGEERRGWAAAMAAELEAAADAGAARRFAFGCLVAAARALPARALGRLALASHALALGVMLPMATLQLGGALFGPPGLSPAGAGLGGALAADATRALLLRPVYQAAVPALALLQLLTALGHVRLAWRLVAHDWAGAWRVALQVAAASVTLVVVLGALFLDAHEALAQAAVAAAELAAIAAAAQWHAASVAPRPRPG
jgi:hypothetical protein